MCKCIEVFFKLYNTYLPSLFVLIREKREMRMQKNTIYVILYTVHRQKTKCNIVGDDKCSYDAPLALVLCSSAHSQGQSNNNHVTCGFVVD